MSYNSGSCLGVIPARGGSKGLPGKNIADLCGLPLIAWTIQAAKAARTLDNFFVSTDSEEIASCARAHGAPVPFMRPAELAQDHVTTEVAILHALDWAETQGQRYENVLVLQPTSPFRTAEDIDNALELFRQRDAPSCISVTELDHPAELMVSLDKMGRLKPLFGTWNFRRRQELSLSYRPNGALFIVKAKELRQNGSFYNADTIAYIMPRKRSVDIDCREDLLFASALYQALGQELFT